MRKHGIVNHSDKLLELTPHITDAANIHSYLDERVKAKAIIDSDNYRDFIYDRLAQCVIFDVTAHPIYMGKMEAFYSACYDKKGTDEDFFMALTGSLQKMGEQWLQRNQGFYLSSVSDSIYTGRGFKLNAQEKIIFKKFTFKEL